MNGDAFEEASLADDDRSRTFEACVNLLSWIEELPQEATGALTFDGGGVILVERRKLCWALSDDMTGHLTEALCRLAARPIDRTEVEAIYRDCRKNHVPVSSALLASGLVSENGLRSALCEHNSEAILRLSHTTAMPTRFRKLSRGDYDGRFLFSTAEVLASLGAHDDRGRALAAEAELAAALSGPANGFAFALDPGTPVLIALGNRCELPVSQLLEVGRWATNFMQAGEDVDPNAIVCAATWGSTTAVVTWRSTSVGFVAFCASRAASALLLDKLLRRGTNLRATAARAIAREDMA